MRDVKGRLISSKQPVCFVRVYAHRSCANDPVSRLFIHKEVLQRCAKELQVLVLGTVLCRHWGYQSEEYPEYAQITCCTNDLKSFVQDVEIKLKAARDYTIIPETIYASKEVVSD